MRLCILEFLLVAIMLVAFLSAAFQGTAEFLDSTAFLGKVAFGGASSGTARPKATLSAHCKATLSPS